MLSSSTFAVIGNVVLERRVPLARIGEPASPEGKSLASSVPLRAVNVEPRRRPPRETRHAPRHACGLSVDRGDGEEEVLGDDPSPH
jgi:hypothetical protein